MNVTDRLIWRVLAACLLASALGAWRPVDDPKTLILFDGKTLDGWKKADFFKPGEVAVDDGTIVMKAGPKMTGITCTRKDLPKTDYEFTYEAMKVDGPDFFAAATFPVGDSHITFVNGGWGGFVTGLSSLNGSDASENETTRSVKYEPKTWYKFRVRVTKKVIRCAIDGKEVAAVDYSNRKVGTRVETNASKPLGFATYETTGAVRKIEVRPLTPAEVVAADKIED